MGRIVAGALAAALVGVWAVGVWAVSGQAPGGRAAGPLAPDGLAPHRRERAAEMRAGAAGTPAGSLTAAAGISESASPAGRALFVREWLPLPGPAGGDGLGPQFNETSCANCHNQGGIGGAGPGEKNVVLAASSFRTPNGPECVGPSVVVHRHSTDLDYADWLKGSGLVPGLALQHGLILIEGSSELGPRQVLFQRNTTSLFGAGRIESIDPQVLVEASQKRHPEFPEVTGRLARDARGRPGRFGWKAQLASLDDFVQTACAVELGLTTPKREQSRLPHRSVHTAAGLDLSADECAALTDFVRGLPPPARLRPRGRERNEYLAAGAADFTAVGCATCHTPKLGDVEGIYSDLLLHDLGPGLADAAASYGGSPADEPSLGPTLEPLAGNPAGNPEARNPQVVAASGEWRTPPLWGVRDSAPYLHHGSAHTLDEAIIAHGGEAERSQKAYQALSHGERLRLVAFVKSLGVEE